MDLPVSLEQIERIEIITGGASRIFGNYAYNNLASNAVFNAAASINNILNNIHSKIIECVGPVSYTHLTLPTKRIV